MGQQECVGGRTNGGTGLGVNRVRATIRRASGSITRMLWPFVWSAIAFANVFSIQTDWLLCCTSGLYHKIGILRYINLHMRFQCINNNNNRNNHFLMKTKLVVILLLVL